MSLREKINQNPALVAVVAIVLVVAAIAIVFWSMDDNIPEIEYFFAAHDGTGIVSLPASQFRGYTEQYNGQTVYRALVFKCGENGVPFVAALERLPANFEKEFDEKGGASGPGAAMSVERAAPGSDTWVPVIMADRDKAMQQELAKMTPKCENGEKPIPVTSLSN